MLPRVRHSVFGWQLDGKGEQLEGDMSLFSRDWTSFTKAESWEICERKLSAG